MDDKRRAAFTIGELAVYMRWSKSTCDMLFREGKIPAQKVGCHWRFRKEAIDAWFPQTVTKNQPWELK